MKGLVGNGQWSRAVLRERRWAEERWVMKGLERREERSASGAERKERGRSDVVSATAQNNNFHSSPLDTNRQMKETSEGVALLGGGNARRHPK